jgi:hypothetical protein
MRKRGAPRANKRPKEKKQMSSESSASKDKSASAPAPKGQRGGRPATLRYLDRVDLAETFTDSINTLRFDGQTLRIEFGVTRFDDVKADSPITGRRYPACRIVLTPAAAVDLINRMQQIGAALIQAGVVKAATQPGAETVEAG